MRIELLSHEAVDTSAIEGEHLNRASVRSSIQRQLGLRALWRRSSPAETSIAELMVHLYQNLSRPLTDETLYQWHRLTMSGRSDLRDIGAYRTDPEPVQIVSGADYARKVHFEAPPSQTVPTEMRRFLDWYAATAPDGDRPLPPITRAGLAHLWFECIHPFEDGNGRVGRAISEKTLAQGLATPTLTGMAGTLLRYRKDYYAALERASLTLEITDWLSWFADMTLKAQKLSLSQVEWIVAKSRVLSRLRGQLNPRQEKALMRMFAVGPAGFKGGLSASNYMAITGATQATTTRDLGELVELKALIRSGERKSTRYTLSLQ